MRRVNRIFVVIIILLFGACAGEYKKRTPPNTHTTIIHLPSKGAPKKVERNKDQEIECRSIAPTGTHIKETVCATKEEWEKASQNGQELTQEIIQRSGVKGK